MPPERHRGQCFCGAIEIEATGSPLEMGYCHCADCRAWSGAPFAAFTLWPEESVRIVRGEDQVGRFNRSGMSERLFCTTCGGHLLVNHREMGCTDVLAAILPTVAFAPELHLNYAGRVMPVGDGLPKLRDFPVHAGGSGVMLAE